MTTVYIINIKLTVGMLNDRRKYNYMVGSTTSSRNSAYKTSKKQNVSQDHADLQNPQKENKLLSSKKITELEVTNKRMLQETTKQFHKFQADVVRVQGILKLKQQQVCQLQKQNKQLSADKEQLVSALKQKQLIIQQFQTKLIQLLSERQTKPLKKLQEDAHIQACLTNSTSCQCQTQVLQETCNDRKDGKKYTKQEFEQICLQLEIISKRYEQAREKAVSLEQQVYKLKQEVYVANSELSLVKQEFSTSKLLHQIDLAKRL